MAFGVDNCVLNNEEHEYSKMPYVKDNVSVYELVNGTILNVSLDKRTIAYKEMFQCITATARR